VKKSKHSPKKLPSNQIGLYSTLDPRQYIESVLIHWYESLTIGILGDIPSDLEWGGIFTPEECCDFAGQIQQCWFDFEKQAYLGFRHMSPYFEGYDYKDLERKASSFSRLKSFIFSMGLTTFDNGDYFSQISCRIASYKSLMNIKPIMEAILFKSDRRKIFKEIHDLHGYIYYTPGQPKKELLHLLIKDLIHLSQQWFDSSFNHGLAFYLAKQDIIDPTCKLKEKAKPCSQVDCIIVRAKNCRNNIRNLANFIEKRENSKFVLEQSKIMYCEKALNYLKCLECRRNFGYECDNLLTLEEKNCILKKIPLFLRTPCKEAAKRLKDIVTRMKKPIALHVIDKKYHESRKKNKGPLRDKEYYGNLYLQSVCNNDRKAKIATINKFQELYPHISRKKIQRILKSRS
jgi:hypothetical protein